MNKKIIEIAKEKIEIMERQYAENFISKTRVEGKEDAESKKIYDVNVFNMKQAEESIEWLENFIKSQKPKRK